MNKYRNKKITINGIKFDSQKEGARYCDLSAMEQAGIISDLELQPRFQIVERVKWNGKTLRTRSYVADFRYIHDGKKIVEDVKGMRTNIYTLKRQIFLIKYPEYEFKEV